MSRKFLCTTVILSTLSLAAAGSAHAAGSCTAYDVKPRWGSPASATMTVPAGGSCRQSIKVKGGSIKSLAVTKKAAHGTVKASGYQWVYKAKPGYTGTDAFEVSAEGGGNVNAGTSVISVSVTVE